MFISDKFFTYSLILLCSWCYVQALSTNRTPQNVVHKEKFQLYSGSDDMKSPKNLKNSVDYIASYEYEEMRGKFPNNNYEEETQAIYPNPESVFPGKLKETSTVEPPPVETVNLDADIPDNSLADADLKDHNYIDSITYLYGYRNVSANKSQWILLMYVSRGLSVVAIVCAGVYLFTSEKCKNFRANSILYPAAVNTLCCFAVVNFLYMEAVWGTKSTSSCEMIALLLHYWHSVCSAWIFMTCIIVLSFLKGGEFRNFNIIYVIAYGLPALYVMFFFGLSVEHYETRRYCWMSVENGMLMGVLVPGTLFILGTTLIVVKGLKNIHEQRAKLVTNRIQQMIDSQNRRAPPRSPPENPVMVPAAPPYMYCATHYPVPAHEPGTTIEEQMGDPMQYCGCEGDYCSFFCRCEETNHTCDHCDTCETCDPYSDPGYIGAQMEKENIIQANEMAQEFLKFQSVKLGLIDLSLDNLSWQSSACNDLIDLRKTLNFCLILQPFHIVVWFLGVIAIENAESWFAPSVFLVLCLTMHLILAYNSCMCIPVIGKKNSGGSLEQVVTDNSTSTTTQPQQGAQPSTTDSIPLLECTTAPPPVPPPAAESISTISI